MEKVNLFILAALAMVMTHCQENTAQPGDDCSIELAGIHFTRSLNDAAGNTTVENGRLRIRGGAKTDFFNDPNGELTNSTAPLLLTKVDNTKPFTFTAKVTPEFVTTYDAGALYIFTTARLWQKFAFEQDEQKRSRIVSVRTIQTSDDNNHDIITQESVHLRISSDTETVAFYYSTDSTSWNLARLYKNNFPETIWLGLSAQSPVGDGSAAYFEDCSLTRKSVSNFRSGI